MLLIVRIIMSAAICTLYEVEECLSKAQGTPVLGPVLVSPVKATLGAVSIVCGIALAILGAFPGFICQSEFFKRVSAGGVAIFISGIRSLTYSLSNMLTLGILAYKWEWLEAPKTC